MPSASLLRMGEELENQVNSMGGRNTPRYPFQSLDASLEILRGDTYPQVDSTTLGSAEIMGTPQRGL